MFGDDMVSMYLFLLFVVDEKCRCPLLLYLERKIWQVAFYCPKRFLKLTQYLFHTLQI